MPRLLLLLLLTWTSSALVRWDETRFIRLTCSRQHKVLRLCAVVRGCVSEVFFVLRVPLRRMPSVRTQLRASGMLTEFLKDHRPDMFSRRYAQCFPPGTPSLRLGRASEKLYNYVDVRALAAVLCVCWWMLNQQRRCSLTDLCYIWRETEL